MSIVYWCLHIWGDSIQAACSGNGQANFDKEFETMIDNGRETLQYVSRLVTAKLDALS
jgi:hypothetical protein